MKRSELASRAMLGVPFLFRPLVSMSARGVLPRVIFHHWLIQRILPQLFPGGLPSSVGGFPLYVPPIVYAFYQNFEPTTRRILEEALKPGMVFVDVGANVGYYTLLAASKVGPEGHVHAIEPAPGNLALLQKNIRLSQLKNITVHPVAAGQTERDRQFHVAEDYVNSGFFLGPYSGTVRTINVAERPLDDLIRSPVDCVKMDIQGTELEALAGMRRLLRENDGLTLLVEWQPACMKSAGYNPFDLPRFLRDAGFSKISALDDRSSTIRTLEEMTDIFSQDPTSLGYCNLLATKA